MKGFLINYNDVVEVYDDDLYSNLENISYSTDSMNNRVEICRCRKFQKQDPQFIVFKVQIKMDGDHYYMLQGSIDLFKSVFPNGEVGNPFLTDFSKVESIKKSNFSERLRKCNFAYSNMTSRVLKIKFDPAVLKLNNLNRFLDTFKMLPIVSEVKKDEDTIVLLINTDESEVGVSEIINAALAKVASNVTYQITEE